MKNFILGLLAITIFLSTAFAVTPDWVGKPDQFDCGFNQPIDPGSAQVVPPGEKICGTSEYRLAANATTPALNESEAKSRAAARNARRYDAFDCNCDDEEKECEAVTVINPSDDKWSCKSKLKTTMTPTFSYWSRTTCCLKTGGFYVRYCTDC